MTTNQLGIRNSNIIVPYTAATKRTKQMDFSAAGLITGTSSWSTTKAVALAYADSNGVWRLIFNVRGTTSSSSAISVTFGSTAAVVFAATAAQSVAVQCEGSAPYTGSGSTGISNANLGLYSTTAATIWVMSGDVELASKPTWADANMEGVLPVDVYIPPASASIDGIVNTGVQSFSGVKTFTNGISLGNETLSVYDEGTWTPVLSYSTPGTSSFTYGEQYGYYVRVGRLVTCQIFVSLSGFSKGTASGFMSVSLPIATTSDTRCQPIGGFSSYNWTLPTCIQVGLEPISTTLRATINGIQSGGGTVVVDGSTGQFQSTISYFV